MTPPAGEPLQVPDGVPHDIVGTTALIAVLLALVIGGAWMLGGAIVAMVVALVAAPLIIVLMSGRAARERKTNVDSQNAQP